MYQAQTSGDMERTNPLKHAIELQDSYDVLPSLPILSTTRLRLELLLNDPVVDLRSVTEVILADPGATLQILRAVGREFAAVEGRPDRIEDCIVSLSVARCYQVVCGPRDMESNEYAAEWQYCRRRAECARELARACEGLPPEEAYLAGLLYRLGAIPRLLGWSVNGSTSGEHQALGVMLAFHWNLPDCVMLAVKDDDEVASTNKWREMLLRADELARQPAV